LKDSTHQKYFQLPRYPPGYAPEVYDKWSKNLIIIVKTKKVETKLQIERHTLLSNLLDSVAKGADILIAVNGILVHSRSSQMQLRKLLPGQLSVAITMDWQPAKILYGTSARSINLIINTYDLNYNFNQ